MNINLRDGWGTDTEYVRIVLGHVSSLFLPHFRIVPLEVNVAPGPYPRTANDGCLVELAARDCQWINYITEFAHEFFHVLTQKDRLRPPKTLRGSYLIDEILCTAAELYALSKIAERWRNVAPVLDRQYGPDDMACIQSEVDRRIALSGVPCGLIRPMDDPYGLGWIEGEKFGELYSGQCHRVQIEAVVPAIYRVVSDFPAQWSCTEHLPDCRVEIDDFIVDWRKTWKRVQPREPTMLIDTIERIL